MTTQQVNIQSSEPTSLVGNNKSFFSAAIVAGITATATSAITMIGGRQCDLGTVVGGAAGVAAATLATKWITESLGCDQNPLGKAIGLAVGIDLGYGLTKIGMKAAEPVDSQANLY